MSTKVVPDTVVKKSSSFTSAAEQSSKQIVPKQYQGPQEGESIFSFKNFYIEYARFHRDETNKLIHIVFIPIIVATFMGWGYYQDWMNKCQIDYSFENFSIKIGRFEQPKYEEQRVVFFVHYLYWAIVCSVYIICDPYIGLLTYSFGQFVMLIVYGLHRADETVGLFGGHFYQICCVVQILSWISQFVGHGIYEKRAPALTTNALFLFIAPFFEMFVIVNAYTGYRQ